MQILAALKAPEQIVADNVRMQHRTALDEMADANAPSASIETLERLDRALCSTV